MQTSLENLGTLERRLNMAVPVEEIEKQIGERLKKLSRNLRMAGFRPGKVPMKLVAQQYGPQVRSEVIGDAVEKAFSDAVREQNLKVAGYPRIEPKSGEADAKNIEFSATFEIYPEVVLGDISQSKIERATLTVGDAEVDKTLEILRKQRQQLEESESRLRELAEFLQTVREEERARIARELHDEMGQALTALRIDLGWLRNKCLPLGTPAVERVGSALGVVEHSIVSLRRISEDLRPAMLDSLGLAAAVEHHVEQFSQRTGIPCRLRMNREEFELEDRLATTVFRVVQETLTNVARHSGASEVSVQIDQAEDGIHLTMQDNGRGFSGANDKKTFGLLGMRERIAMLGGRLGIDSRPGQGTRITAWLPHHKATRT